MNHFDRVMNMTTILVTGGAGFIGYHLTKYLLERDVKVVVYDNFSDYYTPQLKWKNAQEPSLKHYPGGY